MTLELDEAIQHCEEVAIDNESMCEYNLGCSDSQYTEWRKCAKEHRQYAEWLKELKAYREILENADKIIKSEYGCVIIEGYADVIDKMHEVYKGGKRR